jgi:Tfp pilus assembly protein PilX
MNDEPMNNDRSAICNLQSAIGNQEGKTLVIALLALAIGIMLVTGLLYYVSTSQRAVSAAREQTTSRYSADAGVEYGLWQLQYGGLTNTLTITDPVKVLTCTINGQTVVITVTRALTP